MRAASLQKILATGLGLWLLVITTALASPMTGHAIDHHHTPQSHSQTWCDWMCKASHAIHAPSVVLAQLDDGLIPAFRLYPTLHPSILLVSADSRAPPSSSLSYGDITYRTPRRIFSFTTT